MLTIINIVYTICVTGVILEVVLFLGYDYGRPRDCEFLWFVDNGNLITPTGIVDLGEKYCKCRYSTKVIIYILFSCIKLARQLMWCIIYIPRVDMNMIYSQWMHLT